MLKSFLKSLVFSLLFLVVTLSGCVRPTLPPARTLLPSEEALRLWEKVQETGRRYHSLRGLAKVQVFWQGKDATVSQALVVEKPDRFRAETLNPFGFGFPLLLMATDGVQLAVMVPGEGRMFRGEATSRNLQRFTRVPLYLDDLVRFILYEVPVIPHDQRQAYRIVDGRRLLEMRDGDLRRQELYFSPAEQLQEALYYEGEELTLRVRYDSFSAAADSFPRSASLDMPGHQARASLLFSELETNISPKTDLFLLATPPGYEEVPIPE